MNLRSSLKTLCIVISLITVSVILFLTYSLAGLGSGPVSFSDPPDFVAQYVQQRYAVDTSTPRSANTITNLTKDYFKQAVMVRNVIVNGESADELIRQFTHGDKATRVKVAFAFSEVNSKLSHDEVTGFDEKRAQFWEKVKNYNSDIQNALFEALIISAQEGTRTFIPYTLAWWMQEHKSKTLDMLTWAANHHPDPWVRNFSVYYVVQYGGSEIHAAALIKDRVHDPVFRVRQQVLTQRIRRFKEMILGKDQPK